MRNILVGLSYAGNVSINIIGNMKADIKQCRRKICQSRAYRRKK